MIASKSSDVRCLVCNCRGSMAVDGAGIATALGQAAPLKVHTELCRSQLVDFETALAGDATLLVACTQEQAAFASIADEANGAAAKLRFTNIRERAGWSSASPGDLIPKMSALLAEAQYLPTPARLTTLKSDGRCLVYGDGDVALEVAALLAPRLDVSVLLCNAAGVATPSKPCGTLAKGTIRTVTGHLGAFEIEVSGYAAALPSSRATLAFAPPATTARTTADLIVDVSGRAAIFTAGARRDGYIRLDPTRPQSFAAALLEASEMTGEFEKPLYVDYDAGICAHSRSSKSGCNKCLDVCPTGAITSAGDSVAIAAKICAGCGACAAVCPTGAASYAYPPHNDLIARMGLLLGTYLKAGGTRPHVLIHDAEHGTDLIDALARFGDGLPANVLPLEVFSVAIVGHDAMAAAVVMGAEHVSLLADPKFADEHGSIETEIALHTAFLTGLGHDGPRVHLVSTGDPDTLRAALAMPKRLAVIKPDTFLPSGTKRDLSRTALAKLHASAPKPVDRIVLPAGAPYGSIAIKTDGCTLCLACVGACPVNALQDNPDKPELSFTEAACVQCGICVSTCPEQVLTREPQYNFTSQVLSPRILKSEEPFCCVSCNKPFGAKSTVERVIAKLEGKHAMFKNPAQVRLIQMCDTCRVVALSELGNDPMRVGERPRVRTSADYVDVKTPGKPKTSDDFLT
jgi:ferredoxin